MHSWGFVGGTGQAQSPNVAADRAVNLVPEIVETGPTKTKLAFYRISGLRSFCTLPTGPVRGGYEVNGRAFAVGGSVLYEVFADAHFTALGTFSDSDTARVTMCSNGVGGHQLFVTSGGNGYLYDLTSGVFSTVLTGDADFGVFLDDTFIALDTATSIARFSAVLNGASWDPADVFQRSSAADSWVSMEVSHSDLWMIGTQTTDIYRSTATGFEPISGTLINHGILATRSPANVDNALTWLGQSVSGAGVVYRANGYGPPARISTHPLEWAIQRYNVANDAVGWEYQEYGHAYYLLNFPSAAQTWVWDASTGLWHERGCWMSAAMAYEAYRPQCHLFAFGKHLVGDRSSGVIWSLDATIHTCADGNGVRWMRQAPHLADEGKVAFHHALQVDMEVGMDLSPRSLIGAAGSPELVCDLSWSDDGGHQWTAPWSASMGSLGDYRARVIWRRLGSTRDRVYRVSGSAPVATRLVDGYLDVSAGTGV